MIRHYTASGLIINEDRLLLARHARIGLWLFPGGHVEVDEDPPQALRREIQEETGLETEIISEPRHRHPAVTTLPTPFTMLVEDVTDPKTGPHQHIDLIYVCYARDRDATLQAAELSECRWVRPDEVAGFPTPPQLPGVAAEGFRYAREHGRITSGR